MHMLHSLGIEKLLDAILHVYPYAIAENKIWPCETNSQVVCTHCLLP